ncbi:DNA polymerase IV [Anaerosacchariphilus sp. NSJ-68]|uniref:DNA polymerase IV n=2 Tax=Lachnospiraceae TaxID=186803 RepID=A0A923LAW5_9FIRM|nr:MULTISPECIES: DNA polymerase IV [Lachnospiraceae]MBC5658844.1 DNA polymerase IV [Anaerosacchariphilus hominis]MBC5698887.1 DNA polymerase IV [Roseburia difficilis]
MKPVIFHIDVNSAYLSWTALERLKEGSSTDLREIPSIIGGDEKSRHGIVLAKSIPAKKYGIQTAEPVASALRKCPGLVVEKPDHTMYRRYSRAMMELLSGYTPDLEQVSIDECYLDFTPIAHLYPSPEKAAAQIRDQIFETFGFTVNVGISHVKVLAKMASDFEKPGKVHTLYPEEIPVKMWPLPVSDLFMVGHRSAERLKTYGIRTIGDLAHTDPSFLTSHFKSHGKLMWEFANGIDPSPVVSIRQEAKGVGNSITLASDATTAEAAKKVLLSLAESVAARLRKAGQLAGTVAVELKYADFTKASHQSSTLSPCNDTDAIYRLSCSLFDQVWNGEPIRLLGIRSSRLTAEGEPIQLSIFDLPLHATPAKPMAAETAFSGSGGAKKEGEHVHSPSPEKLKKLDAAMDVIRKKYGQNAIHKGELTDFSDR